MNKMKFPDNQAEQAILDLARELSFEVKDLVYTPNDKLSGLVRDSGSSDWKWVLAKPDSKVQISVSVLYPYWSVVLHIFKAHALTDMHEILNGNEWPNIEFNIEDYVDADALDRMYEDQLSIIEEVMNKKDKKGWLHIVNFKKKK